MVASLPLSPIPLRSPFPRWIRLLCPSLLDRSVTPSLGADLGSRWIIARSKRRKIDEIGLVSLRNVGTRVRLL